MKQKLLGAVFSLSASACVLMPMHALCQASGPGSGEVMVRGNELLRDGMPWIPHGFYQIAFEVAPGNLSRADHPFWANAQQHYTPEEDEECAQLARI